jgi:uncharacterized protein
LSTEGKVSINLSTRTPNNPKVVVGVPDAGLVGTIACSYVIQQLGLHPIGHIDSDLLPPMMVIHGSKPCHPIQIFGGASNLLVVLSEIPLSPRSSFQITKALAAWARSMRAEVVIGVSGLPSRRREESPDGKPAILGIALDEKTLKGLTALGVLPFEEGIVSGTHASLMKQCMSNGQSCLLLMAESLIQFPDPSAAGKAVEVLGGLLSVKIDLEPLMHEAEEIRLRNRELMQQTQEAQHQQQMGQITPGVYK